MHLRPTPVLLSAAMLAAVLISCSVTFTDDVKYSCTQDSDCGGDGFVCAKAPSRAVCCKPSGPEVCDKVDNDCDGFVDNTGKLETCNGQDDDCNGAVDDGFDLRTNSNHCVECNHACPGTQYCKASMCTIRLEANCFDNFDDDGNGLTDCEDPSCDGRACGTSCVCDQDKGRTEDRCDDNKSNDGLLDGGGDQLIDCFDPDCTGKSCRDGCTCAPDAGQVETNCMDGQDNDLDNKADCLDPDCVNEFCTPPSLYYRCTAMQTCRCNGGVQISEVGSVLCRDGIDNDCDGEIDCDEASCIGQSCSPDAGAVACECSGTGKKETGCANLTDDDGDQLIDCADTDCGQGTACATADGGMGMCTTAKTCE